jgi:aminocarboxymuconate-semialdehyde decarboxylase
VTFLRAGSQEIQNLEFTDSPLSNIDKRLGLMEQMGVDHQLLSPMPMFYFYDQPARTAIRFARLHNDEMAKFVAAGPKRFSGLATLPMQDGAAAAAELRRAVTELGLCGAQIGQGAVGMPLSAPENEILWETCEQLGVPLIIHPEPLAAVSANPSTPDKKANWDLDMVAGLPGLEFRVVAELVFSGVLDRHAGLRVVIPHGGGSAPYNKGRLAMALKRRPWGKGLLHRPLGELWDQIWFDCLVHGPDALQFLVNSAGARKVLLGTNAAAWDQENEIVEAVRDLGLAPANEARILTENSAGLFGIAV